MNSFCPNHVELSWVMGLPPVIIRFFNGIFHEINQPFFETPDTKPRLQGHFSSGSSNWSTPRAAAKPSSWHADGEQTNRTRCTGETHDFEETWYLCKNTRIHLFISYHIIFISYSYHIISYHIISYHIISYICMLCMYIFMIYINKHDNSHAIWLNCTKSLNC